MPALITRRGLIIGSTAAICAPAIVRVTSIMPVRKVLLNGTEAFCHDLLKLIFSGMWATNLIEANIAENFYGCSIHIRHSDDGGPCRGLVE